MIEFTFTFLCFFNTHKAYINVNGNETRPVMEEALGKGSALKRRDLKVPVVLNAVRVRRALADMDSEPLLLEKMSWNSRMQDLVLTHNGGRVGDAKQQSGAG